MPTQRDSASSVRASLSCIQTEKSRAGLPSFKGVDGSAIIDSFMGCIFRQKARTPGSVLGPGRQLAFVQYLDLLLHGFELAAAKAQQLGRTLVAAEHLLQRQLTRFDLRNQLFQLLQSSFIADRLFGFLAAAALGMDGVGYVGRKRRF
jgi:hypothetical protein